MHTAYNIVAATQRWLCQEAERLAQREGEHFGDDLGDATSMFVWLVETGKRET